MFTELGNQEHVLNYVIKPCNISQDIQVRFCIPLLHPTFALMNIKIFITIKGIIIYNFINDDNCGIKESKNISYNKVNHQHNGSSYNEYLT